MEIRGVYRAFSPQIVRKFDLLPGYVFIFSEERLTDYRLFCDMDGVIRRVGLREGGYELEGPDLDFAMKLLEKDGLVRAMSVCRIGDEVVLGDSLFNGCQGRVTEIDYRKERARVDFMFDKMACYTWISVDGIKKQGNTEEES